MRKHLAIFKSEIGEAILSGKKTIETRFSKHRIAPYGSVSAGDLVYIKPTGDEIIGQFRVKKVFSYEGLTEGDVEKIFQDYGSKILIGNKEEDEKYVADKKKSSYGTLIFIGDSERFITSPIKIKKSDQRGWVVLTE